MSSASSHTHISIPTGGVGNAFILAAGLVVLALVLSLIMLGPAFDLSRNVANLSPEQQAEAQQLLDSLVAAIDEERYADAEEISGNLDQFNKTMLEGLGETQSKVICAWCAVVMGNSDTPEDTHSVCGSCKSGLLEGWEE